MKFIKRNRKNGQIGKIVKTLPWYGRMKQNIKVNYVLCIDKKKNYMKIMLKIQIKAKTI